MLVPTESQSQGRGWGASAKKKKVQMQDEETDQAWLSPGHRAEVDSVTSARPVRTQCSTTGMQQQQPCFDFFFSLSEMAYCLTLPMLSPWG